MKRVLSFVWLQATWFATVLGAAHGLAWIGPVVILVTLGIHVREQRDRPVELKVLAVATLVGFLIDTGLLRFGVVRIPGWSVSPPWLVALWPNFLSTTSKGQLLSSLPRRPVLASLLGAMGGPLAYDAAGRLGAIGLGGDRLVALVTIGVVWSLVVPGLVLVRARLGADA